MWTPVRVSNNQMEKITNVCTVTRAMMNVKKKKNPTNGWIKYSTKTTHSNTHSWLVSLYFSNLVKLVTGIITIFFLDCVRWPSPFVSSHFFTLLFFVAIAFYFHAAAFARFPQAASIHHSIAHACSNTFFFLQLCCSIREKKGNRSPRILHTWIRCTSIQISFHFQVINHRCI